MKMEPDEALHRSPAPVVSVGMPAYNSAKWIEASIESILAQTFQNLELVISDNASTDDTLAICERYARRDSRVRVLRQPENRGANENYLAVLRAARGTYFKWASSNDLCARSFIEKCVDALEKDHAAVLACPRAGIFDSSPDAIQPYASDLALTSDSPAQRFLDLQNGMGLNNAINGVIRRDALMRTRLGNFLRADIILAAELSVLGKFLLVDDVLFFRRMSPESITVLRSEREIEFHHVPSAKAPLKWQLWQYQIAQFKIVRLLPFLSRDWFRIMDYGLRSLVWVRGKLIRESWRSIRGAGAM